MSDEAARLSSEKGVLTAADGPPTADQTPPTESPVVPLDPTPENTIPHEPPQAELNNEPPPALHCDLHDEANCCSLSPPISISPMASKPHGGRAMLSFPERATLVARGL